MTKKILVQLVYLSCFSLLFNTKMNAQNIEYGIGPRVTFNYFEFENGDFFDPLTAHVTLKPKLSVFTNVKTSDAFYIQIKASAELKSAKLKYSGTEGQVDERYKIKFDFFSYDLGFNGNYRFLSKWGLISPYLGAGFSWTKFTGRSSSYSVSRPSNVAFTSRAPELNFSNNPIKTFFYPAIEGGLTFRPNKFVKENRAYEFMLGAHYSPNIIDDISTSTSIVGLDESIRGRFLILSIGWNVLLLE